MVTAMSKRVAEGGGRRREEETERERERLFFARRLRKRGRRGMQNETNDESRASGAGCEGILPFNM